MAEIEGGWSSVAVPVHGDTLEFPKGTKFDQSWSSDTKPTIAVAREIQEGQIAQTSAQSIK